MSKNTAHVISNGDYWVLDYPTLPGHMLSDLDSATIFLNARAAVDYRAIMEDSSECQIHTLEEARALVARVASDHREGFVISCSDDRWIRSEDGTVSNRVEDAFVCKTFEEAEALRLRLENSAELLVHPFKDGRGLVPESEAPTHIRLNLPNAPIMVVRAKQSDLGCACLYFSKDGERRNQWVPMEWLTDGRAHAISAADAADASKGLDIRLHPNEVTERP